VTKGLQAAYTVPLTINFTGTDAVLIQNVLGSATPTLRQWRYRKLSPLAKRPKSSSHALAAKAGRDDKQKWHSREHQRAWTLHLNFSYGSTIPQSDALCWQAIQPESKMRAPVAANPK
jgi:hypothetical protein